VSSIEYQAIEDPLGFVRRLGIGPARDIGLLDTAVVRPRSSAFGEDANPTLRLEAAAPLHSIVTIMPWSMATSGSDGWRQPYSST